jgi:SIR2-like protein
LPPRATSARELLALKFETNLGLLLRWQQVRHLEERFQDLGGPHAGSHLGQIEEARRYIDNRMGTVLEAINVTLYEQFGQRRIDDDKASEAFRVLLKHLGDPEIVLATTNYDRAGETALATLGHTVDTGFRHRPNRTPVLEPAELGFGTRTPVIHLHGAVGWYERDGSVGDFHADQPFNPSLGTPVVLYPDPDKDPTNDAVVSLLWAEFNNALIEADSVLVIGHSLHDPALVRALRRVTSAKPVVISYFDGNGLEIVESKLPGAIPIELDFGPEIVMDGILREMVEKGTRPAAIEMDAARNKQACEIG